MTRSYIFKLLHSPYLYGAMAVILGFCLLIDNISLGGKQGLNGTDVYVDILLLLQVDEYRKFFVILGSLPFAANFADEWNSKTVTNCVTRKSVLSYSVSNVTVCFISTFVTIFIPLVFFAGSDCFTKDVYYVINGPGESYGVFQTMGLPFLSIVMVIYGYAVSASMWSVAGMTLSAFFPSNYIAIGTPFVLCSVFEQLTWNAPPMMNFAALANSRIWIPDGLMFLYTLMFFGGLSAGLGALFAMRVEKRICNELG